MKELGEYCGIYRKAWEEAKCLHGMRTLGAITPQARGLSVGAGVERPLFWLANHVREIVATDLYEDSEDWPWSSDFLGNPEKYAPFPYRTDGLTVRRMSGTDLEFDENTFDFVYTLSSIEHFGGTDAASRCIREMARVTKRGGVVCVVTELLLNRKPIEDCFTIDQVHQYLIRENGLTLIEPEIDLRISRSLLAYPVALDYGTSLAVSPHIVVSGPGGAIWTSLILFFRKQH